MKKQTLDESSAKIVGDPFLCVRFNWQGQPEEGMKDFVAPMRATTRLPKGIRDAVVNTFVEHGLAPPYILYRTTEFADESPHNLLPSERTPKGQKGWTVYLVFHGKPPALHSLKKIVAFPDSRAGELPLLAKPRLGKHKKPDLKKADLHKVPNEFTFKSLEDLSNYLRRSGQ